MPTFVTFAINVVCLIFMFSVGFFLVVSIHLCDNPQHKFYMIFILIIHTTVFNIMCVL